MAEYALHSDVSDRLKGIYPAGFTDTTQPTKVTVEKWLDQAEALLNATLKAMDMPAPYTDPDAVNILGRIIADYAEGMTRRLLAATGGDGRNIDGQSLIDRFDQVIKDIQVRHEFWANILGESSSAGESGVSSHVTARPGGLQDSDKDPWTSRDTKF